MGRKSLTIEKMHELAASKGGKCLSNKYVNVFTKLTWQCKKGHIWSATPHHVRLGTWCPSCAKNVKPTIRQLQELAVRKEGTCLSNTYVNAATKILWECAEGHTWYSIPGGIKKGQWCPKCSGGISERLCREYFEHIFNEKFPKVRPEWLIGKKGRSLELDGYCKKLKLAFEYQGSQHYKQINFFHTKRSFEEQQSVDELKRKACKEHGIILIEIPDLPNKERLESLILQECMKKEVATPQFEFNPNDFKVYSPKKLKVMQYLAEARGGRCLSSQYVNSQTNLTWQCSKGHTWKAIPNNVKRGTWCILCSNEAARQAQRGTLSEMKELAASRKGKCLSESYINANSKLLWECDKGHKWEATPGSVKSGTWCPKCNKGSKKDPKNWVELKCLNCGKDFEEYAHRIKESRGKFCSKTCFDNFRRGKQLPNRKGKVIVCSVCGKEFYTPISRLGLNRGKYCSKPCYYLSKKGKPSPKYAKVKKTCDICGKMFAINKAREKTAKFCSNDCRYTAEIGRSPHNKGKKYELVERLNRQCIQCGKTIKLRPSELKLGQRKGKFCSYNCYWTNMKGKPTWNKGTKGVMKPNHTTFIKGHITWNKGITGGQIPWNKGKTGIYSLDTLKKISENRKGKRAGKEHPMYGKNTGKKFEEIYGETKAKEIKKKMSDKQREQDFMSRLKRKEAMRSKFKDKTFRKKNLENITKLHTNPVLKLKALEASRKASKIYTRPERYVAEICKYNHLPFRFTGSGKTAQQLFGKYPDFICTDGRKLIIEVFGEFHHSDEFIKKYRSDPVQSPEGRVAFWKKHGYETLILWGKECLTYGICLRKIQEFSQMYPTA